MDLLTWLKLYWRQDTQRTKWLYWCDGKCWVRTEHLVWKVAGTKRPN